MKKGIIIRKADAAERTADVRPGQVEDPLPSSPAAQSLLPVSYCFHWDRPFCGSCNGIFIPLSTATCAESKRPFCDRTPINMIVRT